MNDFDLDFLIYSLFFFPLALANEKWLVCDLHFSGEDAPVAELVDFIIAAQTGGTSGEKDIDDSIRGKDVKVFYSHAWIEPLSSLNL